MDALGIEHIHSVIGGSVGVDDCTVFCRIKQPTCGTGPAYRSECCGQSMDCGESYRAPAVGFPTRHVAWRLPVKSPTSTYRAEAGLEIRHGRRQAKGGESLVSPYAVQTYLEHQGRALCNRFTVGAYLAQLDCMDNHDLARPPRQPDP